jgi:hypothetical protein
LAIESCGGSFDQAPGLYCQRCRLPLQNFLLLYMAANGQSIAVSEKQSPCLISEFRWIFGSQSRIRTLAAGPVTIQTDFTAKAQVAY